VSTLTLGEICRAHAKELLSLHGTKLPDYQKSALWCLSRCRTEALGGYIVECAECQQRSYFFKSCRHRGCPQCEGAKEAAWMLARQDELLPTHYFHVVFTVPHCLNELFLKNQPLGYSIFFSAVAKALTTVVGNRLGGAKIGFFSILHTWGQRLDLHPHIHCVVPGGGIAPDGNWVLTSKKRRFLVSTKVLAEVFRAILLKKLRQAYRKKKIHYQGDLETLFNQAVRKKWVVHAKPPFSSPLCVLKYLSRYTRKVALSNSRLLSLKNGMVTFRFKDYAQKESDRICTINAVEFLRRFLMHIPKPGFMRIRYFGFMAGPNRKARINQLKERIAGVLPVVQPQIETAQRGVAKSLSTMQCCPACGSANLIHTEFAAKNTLKADSS
jgi:Putative transposase/Transposase zinc-binding domain